MGPEPLLPTDMDPNSLPTHPKTASPPLPPFHPKPHRTKRSSLGATIEPRSSPSPSPSPQPTSNSISMQNLDETTTPESPYPIPPPNTDSPGGRDVFSRPLDTVTPTRKQSAPAISRNKPKIPVMPPLRISIYLSSDNSPLDDPPSQGNQRATSTSASASASGSTLVSPRATSESLSNRSHRSPGPPGHEERQSNALTQRRNTLWSLSSHSFSSPQSVKELKKRARSLKFLLTTEKWTSPELTEIAHRLREWKTSVIEAKKQQAQLLIPLETFELCHKIECFIESSVEYSVIINLIQTNPEVLQCPIFSHTRLDSPYCYLIHLASSRDLVPVLEYINNTKHSELETLSSYGTSALHYAAQYGAFNSLRFLLFHGGDVNLRSKSGYSALSFALKRFCFELRAETRPWLLPDVFFLSKLRNIEFLIASGFKVTEEDMRKGLLGEEWMIILLSEFVNHSNYVKNENDDLWFSNRSKWIERFKLACLKETVPTGSLFAVFTGLHDKL